MQKQYLDYAGLKRVLKHLLPPIDAKPTCHDTDGNLVKNQKIVELTKEQYDALAVKDPDTYYMMADDNLKPDKHVKCGFATYTQDIAPGANITIPVVFKSPMPNTDYAILISKSIQGSIWGDLVVRVIDKTVNGFNIIIYNFNYDNTHKPETGSGVYWCVEPYGNS